MSDGASPKVLTPFAGTRRFRRNARLAIQAGALIATDRRGCRRIYPMDGTPDAPTRFAVTLASDERDGNGRFAYLDGRGQAVVRGLNDHWNHFEQTEFNDPAGIVEGLVNPPPSGLTP